MERKITARLLEWKNSPYRKPLLLCGARQVGKTYAVLQFGGAHYKNTAYFNFEFNRQISEIFEKDLDPVRIVNSLSAYSGIDILEKDTLIVLDEIQSCKRALTSLKYFNEKNPEYHIIATGSLLGIALKKDDEGDCERNDFSFPVGNVNILRMHPMDLEEFMWATGNRKISDGIRKAISAQERYDLHEKAMDIYRMYLTIGGLPEAVKRYTEGADASSIAAVHADIDVTYMGDMSKYTTKAEAVAIRAIWSSIPRQLIKENKRFVLRDVSEGARTRELGTPLDWLRTAGLVNRCERISTGEIPLSVHTEGSDFKLYMVDTGLLISKLGIPSKMILSDSSSLDMYKGAHTENYVMQALRANEIDPYYWSPTPNKEVDFIFQDSEGGVVPVEVKSAKHVTSISLSAFADKYRPHYSVRASAKNIGFENGIFSIPLYAVFCLNKDICDVPGNRT